MRYPMKIPLLCANGRGVESCIPLDNWVVLGEPTCREAEQLEAGRQHLLLLSKCVYL